MTREQILKLIKHTEQRKTEMAERSSRLLKTMEKAMKTTKSEEMKMIYEETKKNSEKDLERMDELIAELKQKAQ